MKHKSFRRECLEWTSQKWWHHNLKDPSTTIISKANTENMELKMKKFIISMTHSEYHSIINKYHSISSTPPHFSHNLFLQSPILSNEYPLLSLSIILRRSKIFSSNVMNIVYPFSSIVSDNQMIIFYLLYCDFPWDNLARLCLSFKLTEIEALLKEWNKRCWILCFQFRNYFINLHLLQTHNLLLILLFLSWRKIVCFYL